MRALFQQGSARKCPVPLSVASRRKAAVRARVDARTASTAPGSRVLGVASQRRYWKVQGATLAVALHCICAAGMPVRRESSAVKLERSWVMLEA